MDCTTTFHEIVMKESVEYHDIDLDFPFLFRSFSLLSWVTHDCELAIHDLVEVEPSVLRYLFSHKPIHIERMKAHLYEFNKDENNYTIDYYLQPDINVFTKTHPLHVSFHKNTERAQEVITVQVQDTTGILRKTFIAPMKEKLQHRRSALKPNQISYYYIEPLNIRNQECMDPHFSLAFRGGGAKGIAYIGAYKAVKEQYPNRRLKSVIGSSAGGMLALAMCTGIKLDEIVDIVSTMDKIPKDKIIRNLEDLTEEKKKEYEQTINHIRNFLHDYGIVHHKIFDLLRKEIFTESLIEEIFSYLFADNESLKEMFTIAVPHPNIKGFSKPQITNYYGLLEAKLMRGTQTLEISTKMLEGFIKTILEVNEDLFSQVLGKRENKVDGGEIRKIAQTLTMRQFYTLSEQTEFTCTAVDIDSHVLRFFNHKTTPDLPVVKAVQMTGSFPVAFEALKWEKEWGKYYIHYERHRKELDLTGHQFTDGGMLANFPIKYLDNEDMRPMYFAHKPNEHTTLFGFGLREVEAEEKPQEEVDAENKKKAEMYEKIVKRIKSNLSISKLMLEFLKVPLKSEVVDPKNLTNPRSIPLVDFLMKLLETYQNSNDNLVRECFEYETFLFQEKINRLESIQSQDVPWLRDRYIKFTSILEHLKEEISVYDYSVKKASLHLASLRDVLSSGIPSASTIWTVKWTIKKSIINFSKYIKENLLHTFESQEFNQNYKDEIVNMEREHEIMLDDLQSVGIIQVFSKSNCFNADSKKLISILERMNDIYLGRSRKPNVQAEINRDLQNFFLYRKRKELNRIEKIEKMAQAYLDVLNLTPYDHMPDMDPKLVKLIIKFCLKIGNPEMPAFKEFQHKLEELKFKTLQIQKYLQHEKESIQYYVDWSLTGSNRNEPHVHLVFQGIGITMSYYLKAYTIIEDMIFEMEGRKSRELSFLLANDILENAKRQGNEELFAKEKDLKYCLLKYVECNLHDLDKKDVIELQEKLIFIPDKDLKKRISKEIKKRNESTKKITSITCSSYHSMLGFFIASGFKEDRIEKEILKMKYSIGIKKNVEEIFKNKEWTIPERCTIRNMQDKIWEKRYDLFSSLEKACQSDRNLEKELESIKMEFEKSKEYVLNGFETVLDYVVNTEIASRKSKHPTEYLGKYLSLNTPTLDFLSGNKKLSEGTQSLIYHLLEFFKEEIKFLILNLYEEEPLVDLILSQTDPKKLEVMWKGIIVGSFYQADKLKEKVQNVLEELNFPKNMTMREYYEASPRKLELNFMAVDVRSERIFFLNNRTFPYMPIWAAIVITTSFPGFFPEIRCQPEWIQKINFSNRERTIRSFFSQKLPQLLPVFVSGNLLASFPLELLTNREVQKRYLCNIKYTFMNFGVTRKFRSFKAKSFTRSYISLDDILSFGVRLAMKYALGYKIMPSFNIAAVDDKIKILTTFINSHDNLIQDLYQMNTLNLPIKLGTLDFHKINEPHLLQMTIEQSNYITIEKLSSDKGTYFRLDLEDSFLKLKFFSRGGGEENLLNRTRLSYKFSAEEEFVTLLNEDIDLDPFLDEVWLQFYYVNQKKHIKETRYMLDYSDIVRRCVNFCGIFYLQYDNVVNTLLQPEQTPIFSAKDCRILPQEDTLALKIKSVVTFEQNGLYCLQCCTDLNPFSKREFERVYNQKLSNGMCYNCKEIYAIRFTCVCSAKFCTVCTRDRLVTRKRSSLKCLRGHILDFFSKHQVTYRARTFKFTLCDFCNEFTESYYEDVQCNIHICEMCCAELIQKEK